MRVEQFTAAIEAAPHTASILYTETISSKARETQGSARNGACEPPGSDSLRVRDDPRTTRPRIYAPDGLSHRERDMLTESLNYMRQRGPAVFVSIEAGRSSERM
jgi:hypothetical protein